MQHANDNHTGLRFLSVCSGIEAASVAWHPLGWKAVAFSEIEKFPSAVLKHHYPDVPNLGDFTKIDAKTLGRVDILAGGTPCQAFSVAGLRQSLADARGNLSLEFVRLAHELAANNGLRNVVWENVVGVLSTKDNAFGCFLAGLVGADSAIEPPRRGKWARHGMVSGPKGRAAWAVKDGQFFGVAQRRRRVLVVADFGNGADPAAVLFEPESMFRDTPPSREKGKDIAPTISARTKGGGGLGTDVDLDGGLVEAANPLLAKGNSSHDTTKETYIPEIARCVATREGSSQDFETTTMVAVGEPIAFEANMSQQTPAIDGVNPTLTRRTHASVCLSVSIRGRDGGATAELGGEVATALRASQGGGDKPHVLAFDTTQITSKTNGSNPKDGDPCHPLSAGAHAPAITTSTAVRRLTPRECERLQGFQWLCDPTYPGAWLDGAGRWWSPDYTDIPWRGKPNSPDGPRYKALGNSWAVPKFIWLGERIARFMPVANNNNELKDAA